MDRIRHLLAWLTISDARKQAVLANRYYYHVTLSENIQSVLQYGIDPQRCSQRNLRGPYKQYACLTTESGIHTVLAHKDDGLSPLPELSLLRIPAYALINLRFDLDQTHDGIRFAVNHEGQATADEIRRLLPKHHYLVFEETIPPTHLVNVSLQPYLDSYSAELGETD